MAQEMKDSGIMWVGKIPANWNIRRNKTLFSCSKEIVGEQSISMQLLSLTTQGIRKKSKTDVSGKVPESYNTYQIVKPDDIVMCLFDLDCSAVFSGISYYSGMISPAYKVIRCKETILPAYANYWFKYVFADRKYMSYAKNLRFTLSYDEFSAISSVVPPIPEQSAIVSYLDAQCAEIDAVLDKTRTSIEEYKKLKQAIITQAVTKGIRGDRPMKESGIEWIGAIPENWDVRRIKSIGTYRNGLTYAPEDQTDESGTLVLRSSNVQNGRLDFSNNVFVSCEIPAQLMVQKGDILICSRNGSRELIGKSAIIDSDICASFGAFMMVFRCECPRYMYYLLNSNIFSVYLNTFLTTTINQLTGKNFGNMNIVYCPDTVEQDEIVSFLDKRCLELDELIIKKKRLINALESYKKSLIYEYVTGKKEVSNAT